MRLEDFLGLLENPYTKYLAVTFFAAFVSMILKASSRPDSKMASQEDWMLGFDFAQLAMFALVTDGVTTWLRLAPQQAAGEVALLFLCVFLMFIVVLDLALGVRFFGWRTLPRRTEPQLRWGAVILADGVGVLYLVIAVELFRRVPRP